MAATDEPSRTLSANCRAAQGKPRRAHASCTGCGCGCHEVAAPVGFRALVEQARAESEET